MDSVNAAWEAENLTAEQIPVAMHATAVEVRVRPGGPASSFCGGLAFGQAPTRIKAPARTWVHGTTRTLLEEVVNHSQLQCRIAADEE